RAGGAVAAGLRLYSGQALVPTSGLLASTVLHPAMAAGTLAASFHPMVAFADTDAALLALRGGTVAIEGDEPLAAGHPCRPHRSHRARRRGHAARPPRGHARPGTGRHRPLRGRRAARDRPRRGARRAAARACRGTGRDSRRRGVKTRTSGTTAPVAT